MLYDLVLAASWIIYICSFHLIMLVSVSAITVSGRICLKTLPAPVEAAKTLTWSILTPSSPTMKKRKMINVKIRTLEASFDRFASGSVSDKTLTSVRLVWKISSHIETFCFRNWPYSADRWCVVINSTQICDTDPSKFPSPSNSKFLFILHSPTKTFNTQTTFKGKIIFPNHFLFKTPCHLPSFQFPGEITHSWQADEPWNLLLGSKNHISVGRQTIFFVYSGQIFFRLVITIHLLFLTSSTHLTK